jgi:hypothetical protein
VLGALGAGCATATPEPPPPARTQPALDPELPPDPGTAQAAWIAQAKPIVEDMQRHQAAWAALSASEASAAEGIALTDALAEDVRELQALGPIPNFPDADRLWQQSLTAYSEGWAMMTQAQATTDSYRLALARQQLVAGDRYMAAALQALKLT